MIWISFQIIFYLYNLLIFKSKQSFFNYKKKVYL